jgi:hypothetical protein
VVLARAGQRRGALLGYLHIPAPIVGRGEPASAARRPPLKIQPKNSEDAHSTLTIAATRHQAWPPPQAVGESSFAFQGRIPHR